MHVSNSSFNSPTHCRNHPFQKDPLAGLLGCDLEATVSKSGLLYTPTLSSHGLERSGFADFYARYASELPGKHGTEPSPNDYLALSLAKQEGGPLLTGDQGLKTAAQAEDVTDMGTVSGCSERWSRTICSGWMRPLPHWR